MSELAPLPEPNGDHERKRNEIKDNPQEANDLKDGQPPYPQHDPPQESPKN